MTRLPRGTIVAAAVTAFRVLGCLDTPASAQAFLPSQGEGSVSVLYQSTLVDRHLLSDGSRVDAGQVKANGVLLDFTYGLTDHAAISVNVPFLAAKYSGSKPHPGSTLDDGSYHSALQDVRFDLRYKLGTGSVAITPFIGTILPSHDYAYYGHGAVGRDLKELQVGVSAARVLDPLIPGAFLQARYAYGFAERVIDVSHNRSIIDAELGYFVNPRVRAFGIATTQITHGGIELTRQFPLDLTPAEFLHHDQLTRANLFDVGGGGQFSVTPSMDVFGSILHTLTGVNGHALTYSATMGATWSFRAGLPARAHPSRSLHRCQCAKASVNVPLR
jgi:hypothetical protein